MAKSEKSVVQSNVQSSGFVKKHITFFERVSRDHTVGCCCRLCSKSVVTEPVSVKVFDESSKRMKMVTQAKVIDTKKFLSQFKVSDFDFQTLIDTGALASMRSVSLSGDYFTSISNVGKFMDSLELSTD